MYQRLTETLYDLGLEEKVFKDRLGLYNSKWLATLKKAGFLCYSGSTRIVFTHPDLGDWVIKTDYTGWDLLEVFYED